MPSYYSEKLSAERLRACYDLAPSRTKAYLEAEIQFILQKASSSGVFPLVRHELELPFAHGADGWTSQSRAVGR
jgi:hypothetical protein